MMLEFSPRVPAWYRRGQTVYWRGTRWYRTRGHSQEIGFDASKSSVLGYHGVS